MAKKTHDKRSENYEKSPVGVKVISILFYIGTIICLFIGLFMILGTNYMIASLLATSQGAGLETIPAGTLVTLIIVMGALFVVMGCISFFIARGIWRLKNWARITAIVLAVIALLITILSIFTHFAVAQIVSLLIDGYIAGYLLYNEKARKAFR